MRYSPTLCVKPTLAACARDKTAASDTDPPCQPNRLCRVNQHGVVLISVALTRIALFRVILSASAILMLTGCRTSDSSPSMPQSDAQAIGSTVVEPAVRPDPQARFAQVAPSAGGIYLPDAKTARGEQLLELPPGLDGDVLGADPTQVSTSSSTDIENDQRLSTPTPTTAPTTAPTTVPTTVPAATREHRLARTTNILVLGSDRRSGTSNWRTDVIILIALDVQRSVAGVISFPRDIYVESIPGTAPNKLNVVDYLGERNGAGEGPKLVGKILSQRLGIPIDHYVRFEFDSFREVVDALGGLEISVDCPIFDEIEEEDLYINLGPGTHILSGQEALSYVRTRRAGGDIERARRQQRVIWALRHQFSEQNWLPQIPALYSALSDTIDTDLGVLDIARLAQFALNIDESNVHGVVIGPPDLLTQNFRSGMFVFDADWPAISRVTETVFERPPFTDTNTVGPSGDRPYCP